MAKQSLTSQMIDGVFPPSKPKTLDLRKRDPPCKVCPQCFLVVHNAVRLCVECNYPFYPSRKQND